MLDGLTDGQKKMLIPDNTILLGFVGSISHGTYQKPTEPNSIDDKDIQGVCIAPIENYFGLQNFEQRDIQYEEWDSCVYEIRKYFRLLLQQNPNALGLLWLEPQHYLVKSTFGQRLIDNRKLFVSKQAHKSFNGYAFAQLKQMERGIFNGRLGAKRKAIYDKLGYDGKCAAHLIRLLRMGIEFLTEGELRVFRHDATQLVSIKNGEWTLEQVKKEAERLFVLADEAYVHSKLPDLPDRKGAERLLIDILKEHFNG